MRILLLITLLLSGCASKRFIDGDQAPEGVRKKFKVIGAGACGKHGGTWRPMSDVSVFSEKGYCQIKTTDAGKVCASSKECQSYCEFAMDDTEPRCAATIPPRWDRCVPGYFEHGKILGRGECFGEDSEVQ